MIEVVRGSKEISRKRIFDWYRVLEICGSRCVLRWHLIVTFAFLRLALRAAMAADAVFNIRDALFCMCGCDLRWLVSVTAVARIPLELAAYVARHACDIVRAIELKISIMRKGGRRPAACSVTLGTSCGDVTMKRIFRFDMTTGTGACDGGL